MKKLIIAIAIFFTGLQLFAQDFKKADFAGIALQPQQNDIRNIKKLSGIWKFKVDPENEGINNNWFTGLSNSNSIAVPGSWNNQFTDLNQYREWAWYETESYVPSSWQGERIYLWFGEASSVAKIWVNGKEIGQHEGGHVPFTFDITSEIKWDQSNRITVQVENIFDDERMIAGGFSRLGITNYDYFPYSGLNRDVYLYSLPSQSHIEDITIKTDFKGKTGKLDIAIKQSGNLKRAKVLIQGHGINKTTEVSFKQTLAQKKINIPNVKLWSPSEANLYKVTVLLENKKKIVDRYSLDVGIRTISVDNKHILLNGEPIFLKGFSKNIDFPIYGTGKVNPVTIKDIELIKWTGANSVRTAGFPHDEEFYKAADRNGILVIADFPAVGLFKTNDTTSIKNTEKFRYQYLDEIITRNKNHPSIIMWNIANEPKEMHRRPEGDKSKPIAYKLFAEYFQKARTLDPTRLIIYVGESSGPSEWYDLVDVICLNRLNGYYTENGQIDLAVEEVSTELDELHQQYNKPCMLIEVGAAAVPGMSAIEPELFTSGYQIELLKQYLTMLQRKNYVTGVQISSFSDVKTTQSIIRLGGYNYLGVFTRNRRPKNTAYFLHERWNENAKMNSK